MTALYEVAEHLTKQANASHRKGTQSIVLADAFARSAFNRYYYACFLYVRTFVSSLESKWSNVAHLDVPKLLRSNVKQKIDTELKKGEKIGSLTSAGYLSKKSIVLTSLEIIASTMSLAYSVRGIVDYEPEIKITFNEGAFTINTTTVAEAKGWLATIKTEEAKIKRILQEAGIV
ncbi:hypothetical protein [Serratia ficaria]|uniref:hypothetical protein n=1 Tax=Serratia ficaria TaxID=61651 RepID=UPI0021771976|nr:hypothetical protein [Serratia ficaria]CAI0833800.1 Uncharacterised protein [Serratia ficaria]CAI1697963.1 Uncharacterised protein [Serratia ficaria]